MLISFAADLISRCLNSVYSVRGDEGRRREEKGEEGGKERTGEERVLHMHLLYSMAEFRCGKKKTQTGKNNQNNKRNSNRTNVGWKLLGRDLARGDCE